MLKWFKEPPKVPGFYFARYFNKKVTAVLYVYRNKYKTIYVSRVMNPDTGVIAEPLSKTIRTLHDAEWAGPLEMPEPESEEDDADR